MVVEMISNRSGCRGDWIAHCKSCFLTSISITAFYPSVDKEEVVQSIQLNEMLKEILGHLV